MYWFSQDFFVNLALVDAYKAKVYAGITQVIVEL